MLRAAEPMAKRIDKLILGIPAQHRHHFMANLALIIERLKLSSLGWTPASLALIQLAAVRNLAQINGP